MYHDIWGMKFWIILFKKVDVTSKISQSVRNIFRDLRERRELKFGGKTFEEKYAASIGNKAKADIFKTSGIALKTYFKSTVIQFHILSVP